MIEDCADYDKKIAEEYTTLQEHIEKLEKENAELKNKLTAIRKAKDKYDMSKDKSIIKAFGAEYTLFCVLERILEDWQEGDQLSKAKELLKRCYENYIYLEPLRSEIKQFLKEIKEND